MNNQKKPKFTHRLIAALSIALLSVMFLPSIALADTAAEIKQEIIDNNAYARENNKDIEGGIAKQGAVEFWSSGGLVQFVAPDSPISEYESYSLTAKHIEVVVLDEGKSAVAMYYAEGSFHEAGNEPVTHYMTRITEVFVKEGDKWVIRAAHYSPIAGGSGTQQTSIE